MAENDRLARGPIFVVDLRSYLGRDRAHRLSASFFVTGSIVFGERGNSVASSSALRVC